MRVAVYNVARSRESQALAAVLRQADAAVVCLVDAPPQRRLRRIARSAGLTLACVAGDRRLAAAILVAPDVRVLSTTVTALATADRRRPDRPVAQAIVGAGGLRLAVVAAGLGLSPEERRDHAQHLADVASGYGVPAVLGLDCNESPRGAAFGLLTERFVDAWAVAGRGGGETFPAPDPSTRRDALLVSADLAVAAAEVVADPPADAASPHRAVVVELTNGPA